MDDVRFRTFSVGDGLSQPTVLDLLQDQRGFIWIATQDGLNRFDGRQFHIYRHDPTEPHSLSDNYAAALAESDDGALWIATQSGGLNRLDPRLERFDHYRADPADPHAVASDTLAAVDIDRHDRVWVRTENDVLQWLETESGRFYPPPFADSGRDWRYLHHLADGRLLFARKGTLWTWREGEDDARRLADLGPRVTSLAHVLELDGSLWVGSEFRGLFRLTLQGELQDHWGRDGRPGLIDDQISSLLGDRSGRIWVGTQAGLSRINAERTQVRNWTHHPADSLGIADSRIVSMLEDNDGVIWAGTWTGGLSAFDPHTAAFTLLRNRPGSPDSLPGNAVAAVLANGDGSLWISTLDVGGLALFDLERGLIEHYTHDPEDEHGLPHRLVGTLLADRGDRVLVGTLGGGLVRLDPASGHFERLEIEDGHDIPPNADIEQLYRDRDGTLWVSTLGNGLYALCDGCRRFENYRHDPDDPASIAGNELNGVLETREGEFWVALRRRGLNRLDRDSGEFERFSAGDRADGLRHNSVTGLYQARNGRLWLGTQGGGVHRLDRETNGRLHFSHYGRGRGLAAEAVGEIAEDRDSRIWVSTTAGLSRIDPATDQVENFAFLDGHSGAGFFIGSIDRASPERAWFGGLRGLVGVNMDEVVRRRAIPDVVLTDLLIANQVVPPGSDALPRALSWLPELTLTHDQRLLTLEFVAPGLRHHRELRYAYRLLDIDSEWIETDARRPFATYTLLPPGDYRFQVRAAANTDAWGPTTELPVRVQPPPWRTPQAYLAYALAAALILALTVWRIRLGLQRRRLAQRRIAESRERLQMALWGSRDELWDADLASSLLVRDNRIDRRSEDDRTATMTLEALWARIHPDDITGLRRAFLAHIRSRADYFESEFRTRTADGGWRWMLARGRITQRDAQGNALRLSGTTRDITELKTTEDALRRLNEELESRVEARTRELRRSNDTLRGTLRELREAQAQLVQTEKMAALGSLVAGIAHEVNTPLGVSVTAASHLVSETDQLIGQLEQGTVSTEAMRVFADTARQSGQLLLRNLRRADSLVRSFKQVAVDQSSEQRRAFDLAGYLDEILVSLQPQLKRSPHRVTIDCPESVTMDSYPGALYQVIVNLVMNSLVHAFDEGEEGEIVIRAEAAGETVSVIYSDNGRGMSDEIARQMFDPFFTTRRGSGGSGLGMHIVYNLVTQVLAGRIETETAPGRGVRYTMALPKSPDSGDEDAQATSD